MPQGQLRLAGPHDPLTIREQEELDQRLGEVLRTTGASRNLLRCELENFARLAATLQFYRGILAGHRELSTLDAALPPRVKLNGINYLSVPD